MKALRKIWLSVLAAFALTGQAHADYLDTKGLISMCNSKQPNLAGSCIGYIQGVADTVDLSRISRHLPQCVPDSITTSQLFGFFASYVKKHPQDLSAPATVTISLALLDTFNCTKQ
jgi:Rap1a immunity proteins